MRLCQSLLVEEQATQGCLTCPSSIQVDQLKGIILIECKTKISTITIVEAQRFENGILSNQSH